jgi:hypothetical protein
MFLTVSSPYYFLTVFKRKGIQHHCTTNLIRGEKQTNTEVGC